MTDWGDRNTIAASGVREAERVAKAHCDYPCAEFPLLDKPPVIIQRRRDRCFVRVVPFLDFTDRLVEGQRLDWTDDPKEALFHDGYTGGGVP